ncbi:uncharacterized protein [Elaeis guineensis]|uniref:Uncharacterized protein LOC105045730 n=1 Tax=Elaeis guineensis var. tenera TaxID=51953 RepID=A0A6I9R8Q8_ELAGV|nr:uncharacterized protein LOC105045730 [Elaeis guineensis]
MGASPWALAGKTIMEGTLSVWGRQEGVEELKARLLLTTLELESFRTNAQEEIRMNQESMSKLVHLLNITRQERDEARRQLQSLLNKTILGSPVDLCSPVSHPQPQSQEIKPMGATPNMKKPDCPSNPSNQYSHVVPFADAESSPDMSNLNMLHPSNTQLQQQPILLEHNNSTGISSNLAKFDRASVVIDRLVSKRTLPEKGRLVQTVMEAGPLLQTLLVAGPLPQWRNPPPLKPIQIPPVAAQGSNTEIPNQFPVLDPDYAVNSSPDASLYKISQIGSEMDATSDSSSLGAADSCLKQAMLTSHASSYESLTKKLGSQ